MSYIKSVSCNISGCENFTRCDSIDYKVNWSHYAIFIIISSKPHHINDLHFCKVHKGDLNIALLKHE